MDHQETHQQSIEGRAQVAPQVPPSLLANVMNRIEQYHTYLTGSASRMELHAALEDRRWEIRAAALRSLGQQGELRPALAALQDKHRLVRATAISVLGTSSADGDAFLEHLLRALQDPAWEVREMAVLALGKAHMHDRQVIHALLHLSQQDASERVRDAARVLQQSLDISLGAIQPQSVPSWRRNVWHLWLVLIKQIPVMHRSIWTVTALVIFLGGVLTLISTHSSPLSHTTFPSGLLAFLILGASATGAAWIFGQEHDQGMEPMLALPTSLRIILLFRLFLVLVYNLLLAFGVSSLVAFTAGESVWDLVHLWLIPLLCLSSFSMSFSVLVGSLLATQVTLLLEIFQALVIGLEHFTPGIQATLIQPVLHLADWSRFYTNPVALLLAALCVGLALFYAPRRPRLRV